MADAFLTLAKLITINDQGLADVDVSDILKDAPLLAALAADEASNGTTHDYVKETTAPTVGFRAANTGRENTASTDTAVSITLKILDASFAVDKALAMKYKRGAEAYVAREGRRHLSTAFKHAEQQIVNGTGNEADGFTGLVDATTVDAITDDMVVDAGGTTASTGSSCWMIRTNDMGTDCTLIAGEAGKIEMGETIEQAIEDVSNGGRFTGLYTSILAWLGLQIGSIHSIGRIVNLTEDSGKGLTDDLLSQLLEKFPEDRQPNLVVMNRRSRGQLQRSRTATNATGANAPRPSEYEDIPIISTSSVLSTESILV